MLWISTFYVILYFKLLFNIACGGAPGDMSLVAFFFLFFELYCTTNIVWNRDMAMWIGAMAIRWWENVAIIAGLE